MLTPARQKIRQELEELQVKGRSFSEKVPETPTKHRAKINWSYYLLGLLLLCAASALLYKEYVVPKRESVFTFLTKIQSYEEQSKQLVKGVANGQVPSGQVRKKQQELLKNVIHLDAPTSFYEYKKDMISVMEQRLVILSNMSVSQKSLTELSVREELALDSLRTAFDREQIKYLQKDDGSIQYWIHSKSYLYQK
ncbi:hypothetical protein [Neobacillus massiliamazoniensis]|uniref:Uncharacterized protein n=1 Tax=Neobacillus massiliamazoniensis TaxID=1499688 RepID=A0A0U1NUE0_9BACI|nr:hypothetical protein [Neobacillus massiliamazoniensis]CRK81368.1 hypothetical protein BN000_01270 [Neobacillus massiliamazoniensis]